jgi:mgtE-like transporter
MGLFDKNFKEILFSEIFSAVFGLLAGMFLAAYTNQILLIPGIFVILPGLLDLRGNVSGAMAARISSGLFLGVINPKKIWGKIILGNLIASFYQVLIASFALGFAAMFFNYFVTGSFIIKILQIAVLSALIANSIEAPLALIATFYFFRRGHDPNNIMAPVLTSTGDLISTFSLLIAMVIL